MPSWLLGGPCTLCTLPSSRGSSVHGSYCVRRSKRSLSEATMTQEDSPTRPRWPTPPGKNVIRRGTGRRLIDLPDANVEWTSHAIRAMVDDICPGLRGGLGFLKAQARQDDVDRAWALVVGESGINRDAVEHAIRKGESDLDDFKPDGPKVSRHFYLPLGRKALWVAVLTKQMSRSANHPGTILVVTVFPESKKLESR